jgi:dolichol-phosphate mannosyltransferase
LGAVFSLTEPSTLQNRFTIGYWQRFIKFNLVGLTGVVVNEGLLILFVSGGAYYVSASAVAIEVSILSNFILNDLWTFRDRRHGHVVTRLLKFNGLMLVGLVVNLAILYFGTDFLNVNYAVSNLVGIAVAFLVRYWLSVKYAWIKKEEESVIPQASGQSTP